MTEPTITIGTIVDEASTTRFYREYTDGKTFNGRYFRTGRSAGDGYDTAEEAAAEPDLDGRYRDKRVVSEQTTVVITVVG